MKKKKFFFQCLKFFNISYQTKLKNLKNIIINVSIIYIHRLRILFLDVLCFYSIYWLNCHRVHLRFNNHLEEVWWTVENIIQHGSYFILYCTFLMKPIPQPSFSQWWTAVQYSRYCDLKWAFFINFELGDTWESFNYDK